MIRLAPLVLLLVAACASPTPRDFTEVCNEQALTRLQEPKPRGWTDQEHRYETYFRACVDTQNIVASVEERERRAMILAVLFGAASSAISTHNFYIHQVPATARYLRASPLR